MKGRFLSKVFSQNAETQSTPDLHTVREVFSRGKCPKLDLLESEEYSRAALNLEF